MHRRAAGRQARALPVDPAAAASTEATPEKGGQPGQPVGQGSPGSQQKLSPGRERMARELGQARQWLAEAVDHRNALQQQQQELQVRAARLHPCQRPHGLQAMPLLSKTPTLYEVLTAQCGQSIEDMAFRKGLLGAWEGAR